LTSTAPAPNVSAGHIDDGTLAWKAAGAMLDNLLSQEPIVRFAIFAIVVAIMAGWEFMAPRRPQVIGRLTRWPNNLAIVVLDTALARTFLPVTAVAFAMTLEQSQWGLLPLLGAPVWLTFILAVLGLDLAIYLQHRLFHAVPVLWRLHRMHHADLEFDVTTGTRFHPIEILLSMIIKFAVIAVLGASALAVLAFEILLNTTSLFNHSNVRMPDGVDRIVRLLVVTPDMHRVHHSIETRETNSNFGFNLPWWDRLAGTYRAEPKAGHDGMTIGLPQFREPAELRIDRLLTQPFRDASPPASAHRETTGDRA
jgi:sterol desaturase/sphingolipid hydroxylase (fatty acid hydroxylase superfamily)